MVKELFDSILRLVGRVFPKTDHGGTTEEKPTDRRYIQLSGGEDDGNIEELPNEYFEENEIFVNFDDEEKPKRKQKREKDKDDLYQDLCFYSFIFIVFMALAGLIVLIGRLIAFPFINKFAKDLDL